MIVEHANRTAAREAFARIAVTVVELDLDRCVNTFGIAPCTATGTPCYNTFATCKDKPNYARGTKTYKFVSQGAPIPPGETLRPYLTGIASAPTEIDPQAGLARRANVTLTFQDETDADVQQDPYVTGRATPAGGTFWSRLLARNPNYSGRWARVRRGYVTDPWDWNTFLTELYVIEQINGPDASGRVRVVLKDPLKLADRDQVPQPSTGALAAGITAASTSLTLGSGEGAQYDGDPYIRIGSEIIGWGSRSGDTLNGLTRGQFGTTAATHSAGANVQKCRTWSSVALTTVIQNILNETGIDNAYIDLTQFALQEATWLGSSYNITACISRPESGSRLLAELAQLANGSIWWGPVEQKVKFKIIAADPPSTDLTLWDDATSFLDGSVDVVAMDDQRITRAAIHYALRDYTEDGDDQKNFERGRLQIDADAESGDEYGDRRTDELYSRWFTAANDGAVLALAGRKVTRYRDAPKRIRGRLDPKDYTNNPGDLVEVRTAQLVDKDGNPRTVRCLLRRVDDRGDHIEVELETTILGARRGFIAPDGTPDYPADSTYAHIANAGGLMTDGTDGWVIQ